MITAIIVIFVLVLTPASAAVLAWTTIWLFNVTGPLVAPGSAERLPSLRAAMWHVSGSRLYAASILLQRQGRVIAAAWRCLPFAEVALMLVAISGGSALAGFLIGGTAAATTAFCMAGIFTGIALSRCENALNVSEEAYVLQRQKLSDWRWHRLVFFAVSMLGLFKVLTDAGLYSILQIGPGGKSGRR